MRRIASASCPLHICCHFVERRQARASVGRRLEKRSVPRIVVTASWRVWRPVGRSACQVLRLLFVARVSWG
jgi:hypothetical protein